MLVLVFKGTNKQVGKALAFLVLKAGSVTLGELKPKEGKYGEN